LSFKEKRQLVRVIEFCLSGYDKLSESEVTSGRMNSTHVYEKMDIELSKTDFNLLMEYKDKPIIDFLEKGLKIEKQL
jgi:hypothetical protein